MKLLVAVALFSLFVFADPSHGFNAEDLKRLMATGECVECDLSGAVLIHSNLANADLRGANLSAANLTDAWLAGANLSGANLSGAILTGASLAGANLYRANLGGANLLFTAFSGAKWIDSSTCGTSSSGSCKR